MPEEIHLRPGRDPALRIPARSTALVLNDMINANLRTADGARNRAIEESGLVANCTQVVAEARARSIPVFWIRVERRPDRADVVDTLTDRLIESGLRPRPPVTAGTAEAANVDELPVQPEDHVILKPRYDPFVGTGLDLQLRFRGVQTILLGGYSTNVGVESCARTANDLGYDVVLLSDCCFNVDREWHAWALAHTMPIFARVLPWRRAVDLLD